MAFEKEAVWQLEPGLAVPPSGQVSDLLLLLHGLEGTDWGHLKGRMLGAGWCVCVCSNLEGLRCMTYICMCVYD